MVNEFDKEIDAMLRDLAKGDVLTQTLPDSHLDADEISAFAENVLPSKARLRVTGHLADCSKCRKVLASTVSLISESESENIHEETAGIATLPAIPWYQKLFAFPNLSYAMGGLAILLCAMIGLMVFQSSQSSRNSEPMMAQKDRSSDRTYNTSGGAPSEGDAPVNERYAANSSVPSAMATPAPSVASPASNSPAKDVVPASPADSENIAQSKTTDETALDDKAKNVESDPTASKLTSGNDLAKKESAPKPAATPAANEDNDVINTERRDKPNEVPQKQVQDLPVQSRNNQIMSPDGQSNRGNPVPPPATATGGASREEYKTEPERAKKTAKSDDNNKDEIVDSKSILRIGGKSFRKVDKVWTDSSYSGGSLKKVKRGSGEYKQLDSGLQNIGNSFKETVIVVWGGKNYRIQ
jgi:hypothetical protein